MRGQQVEIPSGDIWEKGVLGRGKCAQALWREHMLGVFGQPARRLGQGWLGGDIRQKPGLGPWGRVQLLFGVRWRAYRGA